jgi:hypothetical protein
VLALRALQVHAAAVAGRLPPRIATGSRPRAFPLRSTFVVVVVVVVVERPAITSLRWQALSYGDFSSNDEYRAKHHELLELDAAIGQGQGGHWSLYQQRHWELRDMEAEGRREMEKLYNGMLRRYATRGLT